MSLRREIPMPVIALLSIDQLKIQAGSDARDARLFPVDDLPELAFDHDRILQRARERLEEKAGVTDVVRGLMPSSFTLGELQRVFETASGQAADKRNFRKKLKAMGVVEPIGEERRSGASRPAQLYRATQSP